MANVIYQSIITQVGEFAADALNDGMLITFKQGAPSDLADYCFIHSHGELNGELAVGQTLMLGDTAYPITAIGDVATVNLRELGHITIRFDAANTAELPGCVHVNGSIPTELETDTTIAIIAS